MTIDFSALHNAMTAATPLQWHSEFRQVYKAPSNTEVVRHQWRDGKVAPFFLLDVHPLYDDEVYVAYVCSDPTCSRCTSNDNRFNHHHLLLRKNGECVEDRYEFVVGKKKTTCKNTAQQVFTKYQEQ